MCVHRLALCVTVIFATSIASAAPPGAKPAASNPQLEQDLEKLTAWNTAYGDPRVMDEDPKKLADLVAQVPQVQQEVKNIEARWQSEIKERGNREGLQIKRQLDYFARQFEGFQNRIDQVKQHGPQQIA